MRLMVLAALLLGTPTMVAGQQAQPLPADVRLRVTLVESPAQVGRLASLTRDTLVLTTATGPHAVATGSIRMLERSRGRAPHLGAGVAGLLVGGAMGGAVGCHFNRDDYGVYCLGQSDRTLAVGAAIGGAIGATAMAMLFGRERWVQIDPRRIALR
jgi:hypothetical protein